MLELKDIKPHKSVLDAVQLLIDYGEEVTNKTLTIHWPKGVAPYFIDETNHGWRVSIKGDNVRLIQEGLDGSVNYDKTLNK